MTGTAKLIYGHKVRAADLVSAVRAYSSIKPTLLGLDWIMSLSRKDTLSVKTRSKKKSKKKNKLRLRGVIKQVPMEVWAMIRQAVIDRGVEQARLEMMGEWECRDCRDDGVEAEADQASDSDLSEAAYDALDDKVLGRRLDKQRARVWDSDWIDHAEPEQSCEEHDNLLKRQVEDFADHALVSLAESAPVELFTVYGLFAPGGGRVVIPGFPTKTALGFVIAAKDAPPFGPDPPTVKLPEYDIPLIPALTDFSICPLVLRSSPQLDRRFIRLARAWSVSPAPGPHIRPGTVPEEDGDAPEGEAGAVQAGMGSVPGWMVF